MSTTTAAPGAIVDRELEPREPASYDARSGLYIVHRRWHVHLPFDAALRLDLPGLPIPEEWTFPHAGGLAVVTMKPVARSAEFVRQDESNLSLTYEGHVCLWPRSDAAATTAAPDYFNGVVASRFEQGTRCERILLSYDTDSAGKRRSIGPYNEGANRLAPQSRWVITQNLSEEDYEEMFTVIGALIGLLNEDAWTDPVYGARWDAGLWLYLGPQTIQNRDGTYTLQHLFEYDNQPVEGTTTAGAFSNYAHKHLWHYLEEWKENIAGVQRIRKRPAGAQQASTIYQTAGASVAGGCLFADLFRPAQYQG